MKVTKVFRKNQQSQARIVINRAGTRSSKTFSLCQLAVIWLLTGQVRPEDPIEPKGVWSIVRATLPSLKATAYRDFIEILESVGVQVHWNRTDMSFTFGSRTVEFFAIDDSTKIRSRKRDYLHMVESDEIPFETFTQLMIRTSKRVYLDFNPSDENIWIKTELEDKRAHEMQDVDVVVSDYTWNPYLSAVEIAEIEYLKKVDPQLWAVFGQGEYGKITGTIYNTPTIVDTWPEDIDIEYGGIDWGFTHDPTAVVRVAKNGNNLYLDELLFERGLTNTDIMAKIPKNLLYIFDSAEPKSGEDFRRAGFRAIPCVKGPDSVRSGIARVKEFNLHVTRRSTNILAELRAYKWDKDGEPIDAFNHSLDSFRYVVQTKMKRNNETGVSTIIGRGARGVG